MRNLIYIILLFCGVAFSQGMPIVDGQLLITEGQFSAQYSIGDHLDIRFNTNLSLDEFKAKLAEKESKLKPFHIVEVESIEEGVYKLRAIYEFPYNDKSKDPIISLDLWKFELRGAEYLSSVGGGAKTKFHIYDKSFLSISKSNWPYFLFGGIFLIFVIWLLIKQISKSLLKRKKLKKINYWKNKFKKIYSREEFEAAYLEKDHWGDFYPKNVCENFFEQINLCQYKQKWSQEDHANVTQAFQKIREYRNAQ